MKKTRKILAIVVTYFPEKELLEKNISAFIDYVDKVLIWENTPEQEKLNYRFIEHEKVEYLGDGINSISHGLNYGWQYAKKHGYDYLLTMDQDSLFEDFRSYLQQTVYNPEALQGIWGPNAYNYDCNENSIIAHEYVITSGMLVSIGVLDSVGGWNESFDIDCVDDEFCLHAKSCGIKSYIIGQCILNQRYGAPCTSSFMGRRIQLRNDSPRRLKSIYKSHISLMRMFPNSQTVKEDWRYWRWLIKWIFLLEHNRFKKMYAIMSGITLGLICKIRKR